MNWCRNITGPARILRSGKPFCRRALLLVTAMVICHLPMIAASGAQYYVDGSKGNDGNDGRTEQTAWKSIAKANGEVQPGDTILIRGGTYKQSAGICPSRSGEPTARITYSNYPNEAVLITDSEIGIHLDKKPAFISLWVYGDGSGHELALNLVDSKGESFNRFLAPVTWTGWRRVDRKLDGMPKGWNRWGKDADGIVDLPIVRMQIPLSESDRSDKSDKSDKSDRKTGVIYIDEVRVTEE